MRPVLASHYRALHEIPAPGTLDGGDICEAGRAISSSEYPSEQTKKARANWPAYWGGKGIPAHASICATWHELLHLKSGIAYLGDKRLVLIDALADRVIPGFEIMRVPEAEAYAANCVRVNDWVLMAAGYPELQGILPSLGYAICDAGNVRVSEDGRRLELSLAALLSFGA